MLPTAATTATAGLWVCVDPARAGPAEHTPSEIQTDSTTSKVLSGTAVADLKITLPSLFKSQCFFAADLAPPRDLSLSAEPPLFRCCSFHTVTSARPFARRAALPLLSGARAARAYAVASSARYSRRGSNTAAWSLLGAALSSRLHTAAQTYFRHPRRSIRAAVILSCAALASQVPSRLRAAAALSSRSHTVTAALLAVALQPLMHCHSPHFSAPRCRLLGV